MSWTHINTSWKEVKLLSLPLFALDRWCTPSGPYQMSVTSMVGELSFPMQTRPYNLPVLKMGLYVGMGLWEVGEVLNEGMLLRRDMTSVWKIEVADGVVVVLGAAVGEGTGGDLCIVNSGRVDMAT